MIDLLKIILVFTIVILLLKRQWNLGVVMVLSSVVLSVFYLLHPYEFFNAFLKASTDKTSLTLIISLTLIRVFENIMRSSGVMDTMMVSLKGMVVDRRLLMASMPALIGLLPSMGGALFSAPMVEEASKGMKLTPQKKAFINYWFRHPWEFILPLYPGVVLASAISGLHLGDLIIANFPYAICLVAGGILWGIKGTGAQKEGFRRITKRGTLSFTPLMLILLLVIVFHIDLSISMAAVISGLLVVLRYTLGDIIKTLKEGISLDIIVIILGVMTFKAVLNDSGAIMNISAFFSKEGVPLMPLLFLIPFVSGLLTGLTVGFVGSTFPIILGLENAQNLNVISFAFASGYIGVLLSPVHLCLVLTREYFKVPMERIYNSIIKGAVLILIVAIAWYIVKVL